MSTQVSQGLEQGITQALASLPGLPVEIQRKIFRYALPGPRIITIDIRDIRLRKSEIPDDVALEVKLSKKAWEKKREDKNFREKYGLHSPKGHLMIVKFESAVAIQTIPALLHTCSVSRKVALRHYQFLSRGKNLSVCIDFNIDTLHFQSRRAWKLFTQKPGELSGRIIQTKMIASNSKWGYPDGEIYNLNFNLFLNDRLEEKYCKRSNFINLDTACIDEMAEKVKFLALGGVSEWSCSPEWAMSLVNFWKLKKLWWRFMDDAPGTTEDELKMEWRRLAAGINNKEEWLEKKEEFTHVVIPKVQRITLEDLKTKQRLGEGFDIE
ncbi:hypothetical protein EAE96_009313 [Botrytis aclada]|nr:hypothetical protein EAE96_009313 [Botrytis aclada]